MSQPKGSAGVLRRGSRRHIEGRNTPFRRVDPLRVRPIDTGCLGRWVSLWKPCRSNCSLFQSRLVCTAENEQDCSLFKTIRKSGFTVDIMVLRSSDICDPRFSWSSNSISRCIHVGLLRMQEIWLPKFITTGLVMPGVALMRDKLPTESGAVVGNIGIYMAYALVSSGHLPLMNVILVLAYLGEGLVARVAWFENRLQAQYVQNVAAPVVKTARLLSLIVHLASAVGDPTTLVIASAYIGMLVMAEYMGIRPANGGHMW